jgi:hypothetical protein
MSTACGASGSPPSFPGFCEELVEPLAKDRDEVGGRPGADDRSMGRVAAKGDGGNVSEAVEVDRVGMPLNVNGAVRQAQLRRPCVPRPTGVDGPERCPRVAAF